MEDDLNFFSEGRQPQLSFHMEGDLNILLIEDFFCFKWKSTSILFQMDNDLNFIQMDYDLNFISNGR